MTEDRVAENGTQRRTRRWWWFGAGGFVLLAGACAACLLLVVFRPRRAAITPRMQTVAETALLRPDTAVIDLGGGYPDWYPADGSDYAVENGRVIFPQPPEGPPIERAFAGVLPDKTMPALVYAPGASSLPSSPRPPIPGGRTWAVIGEWFLYDCHPVHDHPDWWHCQLLVGGNI
jgi:hypothetical protein